MFLNALWLKKCVTKQSIDAYLYLTISLLGIKLKECVIDVSEGSSFIAYCPDKYLTQKMSNEPAGDSLASMKLIPDWFVASKMIKRLFTALYADETILYYDEDSGNVAFICNKMGILNIDINNIIIIVIVTSMKMILILLFLSDIWVGILNLKNTKHL